MDLPSSFCILDIEIMSSVMFDCAYLTILYDVGTTYSQSLELIQLVFICPGYVRYVQFSSFHVKTLGGT